MALECFRNTRLEDFHEGTYPASQSGDYSDVKVVTPFGEIMWRVYVSRLSDGDMKLLMIDVTNHCHKFLAQLFLDARGEAIIEALKERDPVPKWNDPEGQGFAAPAGLAGWAMIGGTSGVLTAGTSVGGSYLLGQKIDATAVGIDTAAAVLTAGTLEMLPGVPGRLANFGTKAFYMGVHTQRQASEEFFSDSVQTFAQSVHSFASTQNYSTGASHANGGASTGSLVQQLQSLVGTLQNYVSSLSGSNSSKVSR